MNLVQEVEEHHYVNLPLKACKLDHSSMQAGPAL